MDWQLVDCLEVQESPAGTVFYRLKHLFSVRKGSSGLADLTTFFRIRQAIRTSWHMQDRGG